MADAAFRRTRRGGQLFSSRGVFIRWMMPYGQWTCADGREVLFDRDYVPICERRPGQTPRRSNPKERIKWEAQDWLYEDAEGFSEAKKLRVAKAKLETWGMLEEVWREVSMLLARSAVDRLVETVHMH